MDYVTITDHDTIDGCLSLLSRRPDLEPRVIVGEEVTSYYPGSGAELHIAVYGHDEAQHRTIQRLRRNLLDLIEYLRSERLVYALNHPIWDSRGRPWSLGRVRELLSVVRDHFPGIETRNGASLEYQNRVATRIARRMASFVIGGSDTHTDQVGYAYTWAPARTKREFLEAIAEGKGRVGGRQLTAGFFARETRLLLLRNLSGPRRVVGALSGRALAAFADLVERRLSALVAHLYLRAQRTVLSARHRLAALRLSES